MPASMAFVTDSNRPQPLWQPPPTACLTASGAASEAPSLRMHPCCRGHVWYLTGLGADTVCTGVLRAGIAVCEGGPSPLARGDVGMARAFLRGTKRKHHNANMNDCSRRRHLLRSRGTFSTSKVGRWWLAVGGWWSSGAVLNKKNLAGQSTLVDLRELAVTSADSRR